MTTNIKQLFQRYRDKPIIKSLIALSFLQLTNYLLPLAIIPYIIRVIGVEKFGLVSFVQAIMIFLTVVTDYGFNLTSTRKISLHRDNTFLVRETFNNTISTKIILALICFGILVLAGLFFEKIQENYILFSGAFLLVIGQLFFPVWFFQGLERMQFITYLNLFAKVVTVVLVFTMIRVPADHLLVLPFYAIGNIAASLMAFYIIKRTFRVTFVFVPLKTIATELKEGFALFISSVSVTLYNSSSILILGLFASDLITGYYSAAEKVTLVLRQLLSVLSQAIYPHLCKLSINGMSAIKSFWKKIFVPLLVMIFFLCSMVYFFAEEITFFLIGYTSPETSLLIKIMAFVPLIVASNIPSYQTLVAFNLRNQYMSILVTASVIHILLTLILTYYFKAVGTGISLLITELFISAGLLIVLNTSSTHHLESPINNGNL
jgi:polysaccharide transporter, PST family